MPPTDEELTAIRRRNVLPTTEGPPYTVHACGTDPRLDVRNLLSYVDELRASVAAFRDTGFRPALVMWADVPEERRATYGDHPELDGLCQAAVSCWSAMDTLRYSRCLMSGTHEGLCHAHRRVADRLREREAEHE